MPLYVFNRPPSPFPPHSLSFQEIGKKTAQLIHPSPSTQFFGSAFMSFMAVAYVPAFLEDRATFVKERANGLYGPGSFLLANFVTGIPYLCASPILPRPLSLLRKKAQTNPRPLPVLISVLFSIITYWLCNFRPSGAAFFTWVMWLFLDLLAAESLVVLISSLFPIFVVALALTAFANGLWMSVGGFLVSPKVINVFWRYWARHIDYQLRFPSPSLPPLLLPFPTEVLTTNNVYRSYVFQGMMVNEFSRRTYACDHNCVCMYHSPLATQCQIPGQAVLDTYGYKPGNTGKWVGILLAIILAYRLLTWLVLQLRRT